jgi:iron complex outermembrane receptor protein
MEDSYSPHRFTPTLLALSLLCSPSGQQKSETPKDEQVLQLEAFSVTGSNLRRIDMEKALPVLLVEKDAFLRRDASTPVLFLTSIPQFVNLPLSEAALNGSSARGDKASVNLRGIGTKDTLALLNGRRLVPHPISGLDEGSLPSMSVNVNQLPMRSVVSTRV